MSGNVCVGVDGCRGGWLAVIQSGREQPIARVFQSFAELLESLPRTAVIGVDIPIGLAASGPRRCDVEARTRLGARRSSVFPAPLRCCMDAKSYRHACALRFKAEGKKMSQQAYGILSKVREVDVVVRAKDSWRRVIEVHPEVSFAEWNGGPLKYPKRKRPGKAERRKLIERHWPGLLEPIRTSLRGEKYGLDDLLDAFAVLWSMRRWVRGTALVLGDPSASADFGLPMRIVA